MKKFIVLKTYSSSVNPSVVFMTDNEEDASKFAEIMHRADGGDYRLAKSLTSSE